MLTKVFMLIQLMRRYIVVVVEFILLTSILCSTWRKHGLLHTIYNEF